MYEARVYGTVSGSGCASKCRHNMTPGYLVDLCWPVSSIDSHKHLGSA